MSDIIKILLQAEVGESSIKNIKSQLDNLQKTTKPIKIELDIDSKSLKNIEELNKSLSTIGTSNVKKMDMSQIDKGMQSATQSTLEYNKTLHELIHLYKTQQIDAKGFIDIASKYRQEAEFKNLSDKQQLQLVQQLTKADREHTRTLNEKTKVQSKLKDIQEKDMSKNEANISKALWGQSREILDTYGKQSRELQEMSKYYKEMEKSSKRIADESTRIAQKVSEYKDKMLGVDNQPGQLAIFADKNKGNFDKTVWEDINKEITSMSASSIQSLDELGNTTQRLDTKFANLKGTASKANSFIKNTMDGVLKFARFYLIGQQIVNLKNNITQGIKFITEMDSALTEIGMVTNQTREQTAGLAKEYNSLAKEMKVLTSDLTSSAVEFYRQGLSQEEVMERMRVSTMYSKIANLEFATSAEVLTATVNSMGIDIERAADVFLFLGDSTATSGAEIGKGFQKVGGTASALGIEFEKVASWIAIISSKTRESAESIGTSINTMLSRLSRITQTGFNEDDDTKLNDVAKALNTVGIALTDQTGNFRDFGVIIDEVAVKWDTLDDKTQSYIANTIGGVRQQSRFFNLMSGYAESMELYEESLEAAGTAQEKFNLYLESNQATIDNFRTTLEGLWITIIDSDSLMNIVRAGTSFIELLDSMVDSFGLLGSAATILIPLIGVRYVASVTSATKAMIAQELAGKAIGNSNISLMNGFKLLIGQLFGVKTAADGTAISFMGLNAAAGLLGVALVAIPVIIGAIVNADKKRKQVNEELIESYNRATEANSQNISKLEGLSDAYDDIQSKIKNNIELNEEEKSTLDELIRINPTLVKGYNERGQAIIDTTQNIKDMIEELERANEIEDIKLAQGGESFFKEATEDAKDYMRELDLINIQISRLLDGFKTEGGGRSYEVLSLSELKEQYKALSEEERKLASGMELRNKIQDTELRLKSLQDKAKVYESNLKSSQVEVHNSLFAQARLDDSYKSLSSSTKSLVSDYIRAMNVLDYKDWMEMQQAVDQFAKALNNVDFTTGVNDYKKLVAEFKNGSITAEDFDKKIEKIIENILKIEGLDISEDVITKFFKDSSEIEKTNKSIQDTTRSVSDLYEEVSTAVDEYDLFNQALKELNEEGQVSKSTLDKLIEVYPDIIQLTGLQKDKMIELMNTSRDKRRQMIDDEIASAKATSEATVQRILSVQNEAEALKELANIKLQMRFIDAGNSFDDPAIDAQMQRNVENARKAMAVIEQTNRKIQALEGMRGLFDEVDSKYKPKSSSSSAKAKEEYKAQADAYAKINLELDKNNILMQKNKVLQDNVGDDLAKKLELMEKEIILNNERKTLLHDLNEEMRKEARELQNSLEEDGFKFKGSWDDNSMTITNLENIEGKGEKVEKKFKRILDIIKTLPSASKEWVDIDFSNIALEVSKIVTEFQLADQSLKSLTDSMSDLEYSFKLLDENDIDGKVENIGKQIENLEQQLSDAQAELNSLGEVGEDAPKVIRDRFEELTKRIQDGTLAIKAQEDALVSMRETLRQQWVSDQNQLQQDQQNRLSALDSIQEKIVQIIRKRGEEEKKILDDNHKAEMESLEERHNERKKKYQEELDAFKKLIQDKIDALDEQYEEEDYLEQLNKEREEANRLQKEIDVLSLDDSLTARNKTIELRKKLAEQNEKIAKMQQKKERDLLKKSLQDQLKDKEKDAKDKEDIAGKIYENEKKRLEEDYDINKEFLELKYSDEQVYAEARESIMRRQVEVAEGVFMDIYSAFEDFEDKFGKGMGILGDIIKDDFIKQLDDARQAIRDFEYESRNLLPEYDSKHDPGDDALGWRDPPRSDRPSGGSGRPPEFESWSNSDYNQYIENKKAWEQATDDYGTNGRYDLANKNAFLRAKYWGVENMHDDDYDWKDLINWRGYADGGKNTVTGLHMLHGTKTDPEWIFNDSQLKSIVRDVTMSAIRVATPKIPNVAPQQGITLQIDNFIKADNITKESIPELKKVQVSAMQDLKNLLIKNGVRPSLI